MCIVATEIVEEHWDLKADRAIKVTQADVGDDKPVRYLVVVTDFWTCCLTINELVTANAPPSGIIILL